MSCVQCWHTYGMRPVEGGKMRVVQGWRSCLAYPWLPAVICLRLSSLRYGSPGSCRSTGKLQLMHKVNDHTTTSTMALIMSRAPARRQRMTLGPRCCSAFMNQWPIIQTRATLRRPREE